MCNKAVDTYPSAIQFLPEYYRTREVCDKVVNTFLYLILLLIKIRFTKCVTELFSKILFVLKRFLDRYKTQICVMKLLMIVCQR